MTRKVGVGKFIERFVSIQRCSRERVASPRAYTARQFVCRRYSILYVTAGGGHLGLVVNDKGK